MPLLDLCRVSFDARPDLPVRKLLPMQLARAFRSIVTVHEGDTNILYVDVPAAADTSLGLIHSILTLSLPLRRPVESCLYTSPDALKHDILSSSATAIHGRRRSEESPRALHALLHAKFKRHRSARMRSSDGARVYRLCGPYAARDGRIRARHGRHAFSVSRKAPVAARAALELGQVIKLV